MRSATRIHTKVLPGHRIEITAPEFSEGASVDVLVVSHAETVPAIDRREMLKMPVEQRRDILRQQAEGLVEYYESTADERTDWQGGDIIE